MSRVARERQVLPRPSEIHSFTHGPHTARGLRGLGPVKCVGVPELNPALYPPANFLKEGSTEL